MEKKTQVKKSVEAVAHTEGVLQEGEVEGQREYEDATPVDSPRRSTRRKPWKVKYTSGDIRLQTEVPRPVKLTPKRKFTNIPEEEGPGSPDLERYYELHKKRESRPISVRALPIRTIPVAKQHILFRGNALGEETFFVPGPSVDQWIDSANKFFASADITDDEEKIRKLASLIDPLRGDARLIVKQKADNKIKKQESYRQFCDGLRSLYATSKRMYYHRQVERWLHKDNICFSCLRHGHDLAKCHRKPRMPKGIDPEGNDWCRSCFGYGHRAYHHADMLLDPGPLSPEKECSRCGGRGHIRQHCPNLLLDRPADVGGKSQDFQHVHNTGGGE